MSTTTYRQRWVPRIVAIAAALALSVTGCSNDSTDTPPGGSTTSGTQAEKLTIAVTAPATGINPASVNTAFISFVLPAYEPLVYYGPGGVYEPALAKSWEMAAGNTAISLELRDDVKFSDGTPVNAAAVKASLEYCASPDSRNALALRDLESIEITGDYSLTLKLKQSNPLAMNMVSQELGCGMIISPAGLADVENLTVDNPSAGAGPYMYDPTQSVPGDTYTYVARDDYYNPAKQHFETIVIKVIMESQAALNALVTGQVDMAIGDISTAQQAAGNSSINMTWRPTVWAGLNLIDRMGELNPAMGDVRVRQAINYAINREAISAAILGPFGVTTSSPSAEGHDGWTEAAQQYYNYDPEKAKALLAEAGYADGITIKVCTVAWGGLDILVTAITPMLAEVGITLDTLVTTDEKAYAEGAVNRQNSAVAVGYGSLPMFRMGTDLVLPDARPFNGFGTDDPGAMALFEELRVASPETAVEKAQALNTYLVENAWFAPVLFTPILLYSRPGIGGLDISGGRVTVSVIDLYLE
ncbi:MAG: ABC transporter substrate-binding protein [Propionibacteriaceae bacterium]|jgi:peptide/nickel transport system substrate-binding protein|nr:ABC transporter substrate-binding protein [Propionibacteriaceae bacterium]